MASTDAFLSEIHLYRKQMTDLRRLHAEQQSHLLVKRHALEEAEKRALDLANQLERAHRANAELLSENGRMVEEVKELRRVHERDLRAMGAEHIAADAARAKEHAATFELAKRAAVAVSLTAASAASPPPTDDLVEARRSRLEMHHAGMLRAKLDQTSARRWELESRVAELEGALELSEQRRRTERMDREALGSDEAMEHGVRAAAAELIAARHEKSLHEMNLIVMQQRAQIRASELLESRETRRFSSSSSSSRGGATAAATRTPASTTVLRSS
jgi:hypothetical protein